MKKRIKKQCIDWAKTNIGDTFKFRPYQLDAIVNIVHEIVNNKDGTNQVVEAPTGSGKSLICIIAAGVLLEYYKMTSYILCSDLTLFEQYEVFVNANKKLKKLIGTIKGQTNNYTCAINKEDIRNADCKLANISWAKLLNAKTAEEMGYKCANHCYYVKQRKRAISSKICVMTYQLYLFIMNNNSFNTDANGKQIFKTHDVLFCDECHNVPGIIQEHYGATIKLSDFEKLCDLYTGQVSSELSEETLFELENFDDTEQIRMYINDIDEALEIHGKQELYDKLFNIWKQITNEHLSNNKYVELMDEYANIICPFGGLAEYYKEYIYNKKQKNIKLSANDLALFRLTTWHENYMCHWNDMCSAISKTSLNYLIVENNVSNEDSHVSVTFKCAAEDYLVNAYLLKTANHKVFTSATVGNTDAYNYNMGFRFNTQAVRNETIPSSFDFSESPIYILNGLKMSYDKKEMSFPKICSITYDICNNKYANAKGMIQTGSYEFAVKLYNEAPASIKRRLLIYNGNNEKNKILEQHKKSHNTILIGPTLNEGIDLPGNDCEFIIIIKVPFPNLKSKIVTKKIKLFPLWYNSTTSNNIIQGIGRGVRYNGDKCTSYILDGCFYDLFKKTRQQYAYEFQRRLKFIN